MIRTRGKKYMLPSFVKVISTVMESDSGEAREPTLCGEEGEGKLVQEEVEEEVVVVAKG